MYNIVALIGEAGSGKDRLLQEIIAAAQRKNDTALDRTHNRSRARLIN